MSGDTQALRKELKRFIVRRLRLEQTDPDSIGDDAPLVGGGLDLDSIDLLELIVGWRRSTGSRSRTPRRAGGAWRRATASPGSWPGSGAPPDRPGGDRGTGGN